jgi:hypothetical protein
MTGGLLCLIDKDSRHGNQLVKLCDGTTSIGNAIISFLILLPSNAVQVHPGSTISSGSAAPGEKEPGIQQWMTPVNYESG